MSAGDQPLTRELLRSLAEDRLREAEALLTQGLWSGAYYLAGYAVELGLKACIARQFRADTIPDLKLVQKTYSHKLSDLVQLAGLAGNIQRAQSARERFAQFWRIVTELSEQCRYRRIEEGEARTLLMALTDDPDGIAKWIAKHW